MTKQEQEQMKNYLTPRTYTDEYGNVKLTDKSSMYLTIYKKLNYKIGDTVQGPMLEDKISEVGMRYGSKDKFIKPVTFIRLVMTEYIRQVGKDSGKNQRGKPYTYEGAKIASVQYVGTTQDMEDYGIMAADIDGNYDPDYNSGFNTDPRFGYKEPEDTSLEEDE